MLMAMAKKSRPNPSTQEKAKKMDRRYTALEEDYLELHKEVKEEREKVAKVRLRRKQLVAEVRYLRGRHKKLTSKMEEEWEGEPLMYAYTRRTPSVKGLATLHHHDHENVLASQPTKLTDTFTTEGHFPNWRTESVVQKTTTRKRRLEGGGMSKSNKRKKVTKNGQQKPAIEKSNSDFWDYD